MRYRLRAVKEQVQPQVENSSISENFSNAHGPPANRRYLTAPTGRFRSEGRKSRNRMAACESSITDHDLLNLALPLRLFTQTYVLTVLR